MTTSGTGWRTYTEQKEHQSVCTGAPTAPRLLKPSPTLLGAVLSTSRQREREGARLSFYFAPKQSRVLATRQKFVPRWHEQNSIVVSFGTCFSDRVLPSTSTHQLHLGFTAPSRTFSLPLCPAFIWIFFSTP
ncbi:hypothetical protein IF1G_04341 [Cordyceps javanica]|uniref:Uncharacterized protein n=1 Tax=Cordyceps javanica TaxID=43265 RepID=A0A545V5V6_9HYPO|nr:hypothetical protein IF1G_04341 [Cordyceps javanica]